MAQRSLTRSLGLGAVVVLVIGNIIGSGVYKKVAPMAAELHSPGWVLLCWVLGGVISLFGALSNAEVAGLLADTGGEYSYYKKIYNRFFAFLFGWSLFTIIQTASISSLAYVFAQSFRELVPLPELLNSWSNYSLGGIFYPFSNFTEKATAIILIVLLTMVNMRGIKTGTGVSTAILVLVFVGIFTIIIFGLTSKQAQIAPVFSLETPPNSPITLSAIFTAMLAAFWAYQGWAAIGYVGGEVLDAKRTIPRGIAVGVLVVIFTYLLVNITYLSLISIDEFETIQRTVWLTGKAPIAAVEAVRKFWGSGGAVFISFLILVTTLGCANATILASCRPYYAMAREGLFFRPVAKLNSASSPYNSLLFQGVWACVLVLSGSFDQLTDMIIFAVFVFYGATTLGVFILRKRLPDAPRPYRVWGYPVVPAIVVLFSAGLFINTIYSRPREAGIGIVLMLTGVPMYYWFTRTNRQVVEKEEV